MELEYKKISIKELLGLKNSGMLSVNAEYQRGAVWSENQQKKLVDSVLRGYPLPLIYVHYKLKEHGDYKRDDLEIIDGQQRINALKRFADNNFKLFDPIKDDKAARFPNFIKRSQCPWSSCDFITLTHELKEKFFNTQLSYVKVTTDNEDEARDLFIRLQAGLPLNPQEKRDAWPGGYTEFVLKFGGKRELPRYQGHDFFRKLIKSNYSALDRGATRTLCAQVGMLFFERAVNGNWMDIGTQSVDDYYYSNLDFDLNTDRVARFSRILDIAVDLFDGYAGKQLEGYETIDIVLLLDSLMDDYTKSWKELFIETFDLFRKSLAEDRKANSGSFYFDYAVHTRTQAASARAIQLRHRFFSDFFFKRLNLISKDPIRIYGQLEREIIYYRDSKRCAVCDKEIKWDDLEIHHLYEHRNGGQTTIENGISVHNQCHPKGQAAIIFFNEWKERQRIVVPEPSSHRIEENSFKVKQHFSNSITLNDNTDNSSLVSKPMIQMSSTVGLFKIENKKKGVLAYGKILENECILVLQGSTVSYATALKFSTSAPSAYKKREEYLKDGTINSELKFTRDVEFRSKSGAASLILGDSADGNKEWKVEQ